MTPEKITLTSEQKNELLEKLQRRFEANKTLHAGLDWNTVVTRLHAFEDKLTSLFQMEVTGGEPDVIAYDALTHEITFCDCAAESPIGRRSLCYDQQAWDKRKENKPSGNVITMAAQMGITLMDETQYRSLQGIFAFDQKTQSWILTPDSVRRQGGALFCEYRYGLVFVGHNGADSYYGVRGFRGLLKV